MGYYTMIYIYNGFIDINMSCTGKTTTSINITFTSSNIAKMSTCKIRVLTYNFAVSEFQVFTIGMPYQITMAANNVYSLNKQIPAFMNKPLSSYNSIVTIMGIKINASNANQQLFIIPRVVPMDQRLIVCNIMNNSTNQYLLQYAYFQIILFKEDSSATNPSLFNTGIQTNTTGVSHTYSQSSSSFFYGLTSLRLTMNPTFTYSVAIVASTSSMSCSNVNVSFSQTSYIGTLKRTCPVGNVYFLYPLCYSACPQRYYVNVHCQPCPYDCLTCLTNGANCSSCSAADNRILLLSRCIPTARFGESGVTLAISCTNPKCFRCSANQECVECDAINDFRILVNRQCEPLPNYYESGVTVANRCSQIQCFTCSSDGLCLSCYPNSNRVLVLGYCQPLPEFFETGLPTASNCNNFPCFLCSSDSSCLSCFQDSNRALSNGVCVPKLGYYENGQIIAVRCTQIQCASCLANGICFACFSNSNRIFKHGYCVPVLGFYESNTVIAEKCLPYCKNCSSVDNCFQCVPSRVFNSTHCILRCTEFPFCLECLISNGDNSCVQCQQGYLLQNSTCTQICGDGYAVEDCDDGNLINSDGCSNQCKIQQNYNCYKNKKNKTSVCFLSTSQISLVYVVKQELSNTLFACFNFEIQQVSQKSIKVIQSVESQQFEIISSNFLNSSTIILQLKYQIVPTAIDIIFQVSDSNLLQYDNIHFFKQIPQTENNAKIEWYSREIYTMVKVLQKITLAIAALDSILFLTGFMGTRMSVLQSAGIAQFTFLLIGTIKNYSPTMQSFIWLQYSFGYNFHNDNYNYLTSIDRKFKGLNIQNDLFNNINVSLFFLFAPFFIALIFKIFHFMTSTESNIELIAVGTQTLYALVYLCYPLTTFCIISLVYGDSLISKFFSGLILTLYFLYFVFLLYSPQKFQQFFFKFKNGVILSRTFILYLIERIFNAIVFSLALDYSAQIILGITTLRLIYFIGNNPFIVNQWQANLNCVVSLIIGSFFVTHNHYTNEKFKLYSPFVILFLILLITIINSTLHIKQLVTNLRAKKILQNKKIKEEDSYVVKNQMLFVPSKKIIKKQEQTQTILVDI